MTLIKLSNKFSSLFIKIIKIVDEIPASLFIFTILMLLFATVSPIPNEEQYLALSKYFVDPYWIPNSVNLNEFPGTRYIFQAFTGVLLKVLSFEQTVLIGRTVLGILFSVSLARLYKSLSFSNTMILLQLPILYLMRQSYFAGSWIFLSMEAKSFAYVFIFFSLYSFVKKKYYWMVFNLVIASYFHVLVGGFTFLYLGLSIFLFDSNKKFKELIKLGFYFIISMIPLVIYMQSALDSPAGSSPNPEWIYTYFRNPHHTVLYRHWNYFSLYHARGVFASLSSSILLVIIYSKIKNEKIKRICEFTLITFLSSLILVVIGIFDKTGVLLKFYLYRINALSVFTSYLVFVCFLFQVFKAEYYYYLSILILAISIFFIQRKANSNINHIKAYLNNKESKYIEMCENIKLITEQTDVILYLTKDNHSDGQLDFVRRTERSRFVLHKFVPADMKKLPEWYDRVKQRNKIFKDISYLKEAQEKYKIDYILAKREYKEFELVENLHPYKLYKVEQ